MEAIGEITVGEITVHIGAPGKGHPPEFWAERAVERIMSVGNEAPEPIRLQALAFREKIQYVILGAVNSALAEQRSRDATLAERVSPELAAKIRGDI